MTPLERGTCRYCACQDATPCEGGCAWADADETLCSVCAEAARITSELVQILGIVATNPKAAIRLSAARWELLSLEQQRVLVMTCRATIEGIRLALIDALGEEAVAAGVELNIISGFLLEKFQEQVTEDDTTSSAVLRLLEPHIGSRIVLPAGVSR